MPLLASAAKTRDVRRRRPARLDDLSGRKAIERFIAAYVSDRERSELLLRAMSDEQIEEALSFLDEKRSRRTQPR
jgi:hypothetical protein